MDYETMRFECLKIAAAQGLKDAEAIKAAEAMMKFIREGKAEADEPAKPSPFSDYVHE